MSAPACRWCGEQHGPLCPWVKALEFTDDGETVRRVEFFSPREWGTAGLAQNDNGAGAGDDYPRMAPAKET